FRCGSPTRRWRQRADDEEAAGLQHRVKGAIESDAALTLRHVDVQAVADADIIGFRLGRADVPGISTGEVALRGKPIFPSQSARGRKRLLVQIVAVEPDGAI